MIIRRRLFCAMSRRPKQGTWAPGNPDNQAAIGKTTNFFVLRSPNDAHDYRTTTNLHRFVHALKPLISLLPKRQTYL
jgi:hypothetical protein